ncbi:phage replisome organizer N-terminal domain-containing protein [[Ruminococcus] gnavus]|jgi:phage replisome organizer, putative, N-terminal region/phage conserved hypothetical protein, C-terminal domain|nr:phage replisome organizer N-terminal domain-containing protein [Mediterraneibacter gnavus]MCZ0647671.1 phage replisome organizer N-terminal domain-containing protein [Mediterraneibacter gnavus]
MAEVKWIKITTDMFDNRKIKHLRKLPDGNNIVLIWVMLLTMAGRCNSNGMVFLTQNIPYTPKMLADELDFEENTVKLALQSLEQLEMIVMDNGFFSIPGWEEHQNAEALEKIREQNRIRKQKQREKQKIECVTEMSRDVSVTNLGSHATDIDKEEDKDKDNNICVPYKEIITYLNEKTGKKLRWDVKSNQKEIKARFNEGYTLDDFKTVIDKKYHEWGRKPTKEELQRGVNDMRIYLRPKTLFGSNFDVYLNQEQTEKMPAKPPVSRNLNNFERRGYDMDSLEEQLLNSN